MSEAAATGLERYGWDSEWQRVRAQIDLPDSRVGRVGTVGRGHSVVLGTGDEVIAASDSQRSQAAVSPTTGDWVLFSEDPGEDAVIDAVLERRSAIVRRDPAITVTKQTLAANVDVVGILVGLDLPPNEARIERFLVLAADSGAEPVIVLSKGDLLDEPGRRLVRREVASVAPGIDIVETSATEGWGLEDLRQAMAPHRTFVVLGPSGVGKSTLLNALVGAPVLAVAEVRDADRAGRHTTVRRELVLMPGGGVLIDTPGLRAVSLWEADLALDEVFSDIAGRAGDCRFRDCTHRSEPGCAVQQAVRAGEVDATRLERYQLLWDELAQQSEARAERLRLQSRGRRGVKRRRRVRRRS
ncbi:MAG: ribosome small subunit-dependent GTPase A [bacterium]|nr:ribosome small subunit-dependent GTPase A [bacterium]